MFTRFNRWVEDGTWDWVNRTGMSGDPTIADVEYATAGWVDWYNNRRLHSSLGQVPPVEQEQALYAALNREPQPV